jgi:hypothetical protein
VVHEREVRFAKILEKLCPYKKGDPAAHIWLAGFIAGMDAIIEHLRAINK